MTIFFFKFRILRPTWEFIRSFEDHYNWRVAKFELYLTLMAIEQWGFFNVQHLLLKWSYPRTRDIHTCCQTFSNGSVTTSFYDLGMSRPGIERRSPAYGANALPLRHRGLTHIEHILQVPCSSNDGYWIYIAIQCQNNEEESRRLNKTV